MNRSLIRNGRHCTRCGRARKVCLCEYIKSLDNSTPLYILQHPQEAHHPKGTAALLQASLSRCQLWRGEDFSQHEGLKQLLRQANVQCYLLWPHQRALPLATLSVQHSKIAPTKSVAFILLDGTWRKAYRMWQVNPQLAALPCVMLTDVVGRYEIRKKPFSHALSTLEAGYHLLSQYEQQEHYYAPLLALLTRLNQQWQAFANQQKQLGNQHE